jgi:tetratricopeptide (TPR) repeat protein
MFNLNPLDLVPEDLKERLQDTLVDYVSNVARKLVGADAANKIKLLRSDGAFLARFNTALKKAIHRFEKEYIQHDEDLVVALISVPDVLHNDKVQHALLEMVKRPDLYLIEERERTWHSFSSILPSRINRERVDKAVNYLLKCLAEELWLLPELQPVYSLQFQRTTAEVLRQQLEIQKAQFYEMHELNAGIREAFVQLTNSIVEHRLIPTFQEKPVQNLPSIYQNLPQPDYSNFIDRKEDLENILRLLRPYPHSQVHMISIDGIGGIGKSALALEAALWYINNYEQLQPDERFSAIVWVSAKQSILTSQGIKLRYQAFRTIDDVLTTLAITLQREDITRAQDVEKLQIVRNALARQRVLLIIDNLESVDDEPLISFLIDLPAPTKAIITTRHRIDVAYPIRLIGMQREDAELLIRQESAKRNVTLSKAEIQQLFKRTAGVPLAMVWSIAQIGLGFSPSTVFEQLGKPTSDISRYCFEQVLTYIKEHDSYRALMALSVLAVGTSREILGDIAGFGENVLARDEAIVELESLSLISKQGGRFVITPLVKQYVLETCEESTPDEYTLKAVRVFIRFVKETVGDERTKAAVKANYDALDQERENIFWLIDWCSEKELWDYILKLVLGLGYFPHARGYWRDAVKYWKLGARAAQLLGDELNQARCVTYLGFMSYFQGDYEAAAAYAHRAEISLDAQPEANYQLASVERLKAYVAVTRGDLKKALHMLENGLVKMKAANNPHGISTFLDELGKLSIDLGEYNTAEHYLGEAMAIAEANDEWTEIARVFRHFGELSRLTHQLELARTHYRESITFAEKVGWYDEIAQVKYELAMVEFEDGNGELAKRLMGEALQIFDSIGQQIKAKELRQMLSGHDVQQSSSLENE